MRTRDRVLRRVGEFACGRAWLVILGGVAVTVFAFVVLVLRGRVSTNLADVLPPESKESALFLEVAEQFAMDMLIIAVEGAPRDVDAMKPYVERLAARLADLKAPAPQEGTGPRLVKSVTYKVGEELKRFLSDIAEERGYLFLDADDRSALAHKLKTETIARQMATNRERFEAAGRDYYRQRITPDPLDLYEILKRRRSQVSGQFVPKEGEAHFVSPDGTMMLMIVQATGQASNLSFSSQLMKAVQAAERETWDGLVAEDAAKWRALRGRVAVVHGGGYAVAVNDNEVLSEDLKVSFVTSIVGVLTVFVLGFGRLGAVAYIGIPLISSVLWTLAVAFLAFGHVSVMSGGFAAILVGLSVDYAIHVYNFYVSSRAKGEDVRSAATGAVVISGSGVFFSALTSAVAFFAIMLTSFVGLKEFGFLAGLGVLLGMVAMVLILPAILVARDRIRPESQKAARVFGFGLDRLASLIVGRPLAVFLFTVILAAASMVFVYVELTEYFFDSDFRSLRAESAVTELGERVQKKYGTTLGAIFALSRGATVDEALANAYEARKRVLPLQRGRVIARAKWPGEKGVKFRPSISAEGAHVRIRRAEILLREGDDPELAPGAEITTRPDGARVVVYPFLTEAEMDDWEVDGEHRFMSGMHLEPGSVARWRHGVPARAEFTVSVWFLNEVKAVTLGLSPGARIRAVAPATGTTRRGWPPCRDDMVRLTFEADPETGLAFVAERGTITSLDSVTSFIPPRAEQEQSAAFVASIDVERVASDIDEQARANRLNPVHFREFVRQLGEMVARAATPRYLTVGEIAGGEFGAFLSKYIASDPDAEGPKRHTVVTYLYPERGELPRAWYNRVRDTLSPPAQLAAARLVSLEVRDIVYEDFSFITLLVVAGVGLSLLWSFRSVPWSLASLLPVVSGVALMLATMLLVNHQLNFVNVLIFPIIVGIGIDYGIHVVHRYLDGASVSNIVTETGRAFVLTSLTTMVGFGSLMVSRYKGLASLGFVSVLGILFCLYFSLVGLPSLLALLERRRDAGAAAPSEGTSQ